MEKVIKSTFGKIEEIEKDFSINSIADDRETISNSFLINYNNAKETPLTKLIRIFTSSIKEIDQLKVRYKIIKDDKFNELIITPNLCLRYNADKCTVPEENQMSCLYKILEREKEEWICKYCISAWFNTQWLNHILPHIEEEFQANKILIFKKEQETADIGRLTEPIID